MNLLFVSLTFPAPATNGHKMRNLAILRALAAEGYRVTLITFGLPDEVLDGRGIVQDICERIEIIPWETDKPGRVKECLARIKGLAAKLPYSVQRFVSSEMRARIEACLALGGIDLILCETCYAMANIPEQVAIPIVLDNHNVEHVLIARYLACERNLGKRAYARIEYRKLRRWEHESWLRADLVVACSEVDRKTIESSQPDLSTAIAPNVVDVNAYAQGSRDDGRTILFSGGMDWRPNRDAVRFFLSEIMPHIRLRFPGVRFLIAGRGPSPEFRQKFSGMDDVTFSGTVPDLRSELAKASICVVPLRIGSGTRLKILEAAAMAKPIVSTQIGAEGLSFTDRKEIILADDPQQFANSVSELLDNPSLRAALGRAAHIRVTNDYSLATLQSSLGDAFGKLQARPEILESKQKASA